MTDNTQELDEILNKAIAVKVQNSVPLMPNSAKVVEVRLQYQEAVRQLILDWHNKQVEEVLDRAKQRFHEPIEHDGSYISISVIDKTFDELIQAERAKLKEVK